MPLYFSIALIVKCKHKLLQIALANDESQLDQAQIHQFFQEYEWKKMDFDAIIAESDRIFNKYPPHDLFRTLFIDKIEQLPKDSPFLASDINEVANNKPKYSGSDLVSVWNYKNPKFWKYIAIPVVTACVVSYVANSHLSKTS